MSVTGKCEECDLEITRPSTTSLKIAMRKHDFAGGHKKPSGPDEHFYEFICGCGNVLYADTAEDRDNAMIKHVARDEGVTEDELRERLLDADRVG